MELRTDMTLTEMLDAISRTIPCVKAYQDRFKQVKNDYYKAIESDLERAMYLEERKVVDIAFKYAFAEGWLAHKKEEEHGTK